LALTSEPQSNASPINPKVGANVPVEEAPPETPKVTSDHFKVAAESAVGKPDAGAALAQSPDTAAITMEVDAGTHVSDQAEAPITDNPPMPETPTSPPAGSSAPPVGSRTTMAPIEPPEAEARIRLAAPAVAPPPAPALPPELVASLLRLGDDKLRQGDVLSARLFFERAAASGNGEAAIRAGKTYDPAFLATIDAPGLRGDTARALYWYHLASNVVQDPALDERLKALTDEASH
jgi:hypothetical protein